MTKTNGVWISQNGTSRDQTTVSHYDNISKFDEVCPCQFVQSLSTIFAKSIESLTPQYVISNIDNGMDYDVKVAAWNSAGQSQHLFCTNTGKISEFTINHLYLMPLSHPSMQSSVLKQDIIQLTAQPPQPPQPPLVTNSVTSLS